MPIYTATRWADNAALIADVASLGYLEGSVLDVTYGRGNFWTSFCPEYLTGCDINQDKSPIGYPINYTELPFRRNSYDIVVFDPPYRLCGTPDSDYDEAYGIEIPTDWRDRIQDILTGMSECCRVARNRVLVKCQDQVVSGNKVWQSDLLTDVAIDAGFRKEDRFDLLRTPRPQRSQRHSHTNYSTLLVFKRVPPRGFISDN